MNIHGLSKTTLLDYPGLVAATIFTGKCNFRCPFCHNYELAMNPDVFPLESEDEVFSFLNKRYGILKGVCITGGEPTLQPDLIDFVKKIKEIGFLVKLDTNGYRPDVIRELLSQKLVDYIAMDIKSSENNYHLAAGIPTINIELINDSIELISGSGIEHEFRTTAVKGIHSLEDFIQISKWLPQEAKYFIQNYQTTPGCAGIEYDSFSVEELHEIIAEINKEMPNVSLRGVE